MGHSLEDILKKPIITEKSSTLVSNLKKYTFEIPQWASKSHVKEAFKKFFPNLKVVKVNTAKRFGHSKRSPKWVKSPRDSKKAIVTIQDGRIDFFPEI